MTTLDASLTSADTPAATDPRARFWDRIEGLLELGSQWLNPILVKEARQAMKSRQFVITFGLLLLCGWAWTALGVFLNWPGIYYGAAGEGMLYGYFLVLSVPLLVVVPFSAFRSLAVEREDGTFELISITALSARQIVTGKLGSAVLQMIVYFSALAPCVAFTYLLRGVDIFTIFFVLFYTFLVSLMLSTLGLVVATASRARHWQVLLSVLLLLVLFIAAYSWMVTIFASLEMNWWAADRWEFWAANGCISSLYCAFLALFVQAAASQISFASDNRSTRLRYVMFVTQILWIGWMGFFWLATRDWPFIMVMVIFGGIYWAVMGSLLSGEYPQLSQRTRRSLPKSLLGRAFLTWFNPGSGTGYVFANLNMLALVCCAMVMYTCCWAFPSLNITQYGRIPGYAFYSMVAAYMAAYLGLGRLVLLMARQIAAVGLIFSLLVNIFFAIASVALPWLFQSWLFRFQSHDYTELQIPNWAWTLGEAGQNDIMNSHPLVPFFVIVIGAVIFFINVMLSGREVAQTRVAAPQRILEEDAAKKPVVKPKKLSPWDDEEASLADLPPGA